MRRDHYECLEAAKEIFAAFPGYRLELVTGKKHRQIKVTAPNGGVHTLQVSSKGDDHRTIDWIRQHSRRLLRKLGEI